MKKSEHILLCGFMAAGKSSIGRILARVLEKPFFDLDKIIEQEENKTIPDIFSEYGEERFRKLELQYLTRLLHSEESVIALGGGALQSQDVVNMIKENNLLVYIDTPFPLIIKRLYGNKTRPLLFNKDGSKRELEDLKTYLAVLHKKREKLYRQAHLHLKVDPAWSSYTIAHKIKKYICKHGLQS